MHEAPGEGLSEKLEDASFTWSWILSTPSHGLSIVLM